ncbi:hypothetical protein ABI062_15235, partial [Enterococcus faecium]|uniref:hypothetical protein n=1 Tax=Enterococcus faecium TaxID=1352 RepID=UPI003F421F0E
VMTFENSGTAIGQTQFHPHGQAYGVIFLPPMIEREMEHVAAAHAATGTCIFCQTLIEETHGQRVVIDTPSWLGFVPSWARFPYEVHLYARQHIPNIG